MKDFLSPARTHWQSPPSPSHPSLGTQPLEGRSHSQGEQPQEHDLRHSGDKGLADGRTDERAPQVA